MKNKLTDRQEEILTFIRQFTNEAGYPPTLREIARNFQISSTFGVKRHLDALVKKGFINIESNASRGISFIKKNVDETGELTARDENIFIKIPILGRVAAGLPINAVENLEGSLVVDPSFLKKVEDAFALRVKGDSMINAGINDRDLVIVSPKEQAKNGDIVVAMLNDETTVKKFEYINNKIRLIAENNSYKPIDVKTTDEFRLIGKVKGVVRWLN
ncbi:MAG: transcriptional repressor LexA [Ignavibacteriota bacterium]|jgi:repressor LexA|nr:MAG: transcriptional repressor LexA [Chlorobiota bacterium]MBE7476365.1 transcriptional repressor LexA [Ignavibacteriales bacterium]MBL1124348.1 transcriptional repressor LexA [Ignavibacteriota bacterium]MBV6422093.1 LexA repressor [Ignavibacteriaceae bacterium]MCE7855433.1 transcriptional repressor LexA [Ignavibacteria bacterium CHB3]MEB2295526.1 transcriptional repressor LexA [Ignavibacteria bacterium]